MCPVQGRKKSLSQIFHQECEQTSISPPLWVNQQVISPSRTHTQLGGAEMQRWACAAAGFGSWKRGFRVGLGNLQTCFYTSSERREIKSELETTRGLRIDGWQHLTCTGTHAHRRACVFPRPYIDRSLGSWPQFKHYKDLCTRACE